MGVVFANNAETTLNGGINNSTLDIVVTSTALFPSVAGASDYFYATIIAQDGTREIVKVESLAGSTYTVAARGADDSSASAFSDGDRFQLRLPKIILEAFRDDIITNAAAIAVNGTLLDGTVNAGSIPAPAGTNMFFYQASAPSQWTIDATVEDCLLAVKGGAQAYNIAGGTGAEAGSWTPSTHVHTMGSHTHTLAHTHGQAAHTHTGPSHTHTGPSHTHTGPNHYHTGGLHLHSMGSHQHTWLEVRGRDQDDRTYDSAGTLGVPSKSSWGAETHIAWQTGTISNAQVVTESLYTEKVDPGDTNTGTASTGYAGTGATGAGGTGATAAGGTGATGSTDAGSTNSQSSSTTSSVDPGDTNAGSPVSTDRPLAAVGILCTKD